MSTIAKVFIVLNLVLALFLVGANASMLSKLEDWRGKYNTEEASHKKDVADKDAEIARITGDRSNFETQNRTLTNLRADLESELGTSKAQLEQVRGDNAQLRAAVDSINNSVKTIQSELADVQTRNKALMDQNDQLRAASATAEKDKLDAQDDRTRIEGDLKRANDDIAAKEMQLVKLQQERDNYSAQIAALNLQGVPVAQLIGNNVPPIEGKVSEVAADGSFVVLSVGENEGVKIGFTFDVYRGSDYIGRVVVNNVLPDSSTARVQMRNRGGLKFQSMDTATTRL